VLRSTRARKAVVLAAGAGRRLGSFSEVHPKPLLTVNGVPLLGNCLKRLRECGVEETVIVVGHFKDQIMAFAGADYDGMAVRYVVSERYASTNNIYSLWLAREELNEDILLLEADIFFDGALLLALQSLEADTVAAVAPFARGMEGTIAELDGKGYLTRLIEGKEQGASFDYSRVYKTVNIYRLGRAYLKEEFVPLLEKTVAEGRINDYYELVLKQTLERGEHAIKALDCADLSWYEIDDHADRAAAEYLFFRSPAERLKFLGGQYGGHWRYDFADHSYIYNPYFPVADLWRRLKGDFETIAKQYPSGQAALAEAAALAFDERPEALVIANGGSEIIRIVCGAMHKRVIVPVPSFNEFENATPKENLVRFKLPSAEFNLDVDAFARRAEEAGAEIAVVVSPNNPTSLAVPRADLSRLALTLAKNGTLLLLDESFVDFCDDPAGASLKPLLSEHKNLVILKSLSKVYGAAGLRLGYLASRNASFLAAVRSALPIWNINGFAEGFLRLLPRYRAEFAASCARVRADTDRLYEALRDIAGGHAYRPQANFVFWRLPEFVSAEELVGRLFAEHDILIKNCSEKTMDDGLNYVRISSRTEAENLRLVKAVNQILEFRQPRRSIAS
jgi:histidinol-phosphate/aromatic aminotransferase/cobyric acid decarboxylase-like protein/CTP:molybdopterin cytidylyltransferase MocA